MKKRFAKLSGKAKRAAFASMQENGTLWKRGKKTKRRNKSSGLDKSVFAIFGRRKRRKRK